MLNGIIWCMTDVFSKEKRSQVMSLIRSKDTSIERKVFRFLRRKKLYFKTHYSNAEGNPDIALPRRKKAVFIDGDFWHGRDYKYRKNKLPDYWKSKIEGNKKRDIRHNRSLKSTGWKVLRIWEHDLEKNEKSTLNKIYLF